jgi:uncharacterized protein (TIGR02001 family)
MRASVLLLVVCMLAAVAAPAAAPQWSGTVTASSDYLLRGVSRSTNDPALSAEVQVAAGNGLFADLWATTSRPRAAEDTTVEFAATVGYGVTLAPDWSVTGSFTHYESPWSELAGYYRYNELTLDLDYRERLLLSASFSPDLSRYAPEYGPVWHRNAAAFEASYRQPLGAGWRGYLGLGYYDLSELHGAGYWYGSVGLGWSWQRWQLDLSYVLADNTARRLSYPEAADNRVLFAVGFNFR